jgi:hypothetical protein
LVDLVRREDILIQQVLARSLEAQVEDSIRREKLCPR